MGEEEHWKPIDGHINYQISNLGRVLNTKRNSILKSRIHTTGYLIVRLGNKNKKIHRLMALAFIPNTESKATVDHMDGNILNNSLQNLRWATNTENGYNSKKPSNNTSGIKGVLWSKHHKKWKAFITINKKLFHIGYFENISDAQKARIAKATEICREFIHSSL